MLFLSKIHPDRFENQNCDLAHWYSEVWMQSQWLARQSPLDFVGHGMFFEQCKHTYGTFLHQLANIIHWSAIFMLHLHTKFITAITSFTILFFWSFCYIFLSFHLVKRWRAQLISFRNNWWCVDYCSSSSRWQGSTVKQNNPGEAGEAGAASLVLNEISSHNYAFCFFLCHIGLIHNRLWHFKISE